MDELCHILVSNVIAQNFTSFLVIIVRILLISFKLKNMLKLVKFYFSAPYS